MSERIQDRSADLLRQWQDQGDRGALEELLGIEISVLKTSLRRRDGRAGPPTISVSDVAQDVVMRVLQLDPPPHFENTRAMRGYLWTAAQRLLFEHLRRRKSPGVDLDESRSSLIDKEFQTTGGLRGVEERDQAVALALAMQLLDPTDQQILDLYYFRSVDTANIAAALGISRDAAKTRVANARMSLAKKLVKWTEVIG